MGEAGGSCLSSRVRAGSRSRGILSRFDAQKKLAKEGFVNIACAIMGHCED